MEYRRAIMDRAPNSAEELAARLEGTVDTVLAYWTAEGYVVFKSTDEYEHFRFLVRAWLEQAYQKFYASKFVGSVPKHRGELWLADESQVTRMNAVLEQVDCLYGNVDAVAVYMMLSASKLDQLMSPAKEG